MPPLAVILLALGLLMAAAYRGASVILFAPIAAMLAVTLTDPGLALPMFSGVFMERMVGFIKLYFPVFLLGAIFGKLMEVSGSPGRSFRRCCDTLVPGRQSSRWLWCAAS